MGEKPLTHLDQSGQVQMVDVTSKGASERRALAGATVVMSPETACKIAEGNLPKGSVLSTARVAAIQAAKRTDELIPLAHTVPLTYVGVEVEVNHQLGRVTIVSETRTTAATGVEMEALVACSVAALTIYDMVKGIDREVTVERIELLEKTGGKSSWPRQ